MNTFPNIFESLHKSDIFKGLTSQQYTDLLKKGRNIALQPKSILFHQGDNDDQRDVPKNHNGRV